MCFSEIVCVIISPHLCEGNLPKVLHHLLAMGVQGGCGQKLPSGWGFLYPSANFSNCSRHGLLAQENLYAVLEMDNMPVTDLEWCPSQKQFKIRKK